MLLTKARYSLRHAYPRDDSRTLLMVIQKLDAAEVKLNLPTSQCSAFFQNGPFCVDSSLERDERLARGLTSSSPMDVDAVGS